MFDDGLKSADKTPVYKKGDVTDKRNYRPVSVLPVVSKLFERIIHKQIGSHIEKYHIYVDIAKALMHSMLYLLCWRNDALCWIKETMEGLY